MSETMLVDTNVFLRRLLQDIPDHATRATALLHEANDGKVALFASVTVFVELTHFLNRTQKVPRKQIVAALLDILGNQGLSTDHPTAIREALFLWERHSPLSFPDCFHLALARQLDVTQIYTFDSKMDRYPGITRVEP
jgi:predicted nucleic acid-binding protein